MADQPGPPSPPASIPSVELIQWQPNLWRIGVRSMLVVNYYPVPRHRFDPPGGDYSVLYASADMLGPFGEVFRRRGNRIDDMDADLYLIEIDVHEPLDIIDLCDPATIDALGCGSEIAASLDYATCQEWSVALYASFPEADGMRYPARLGGPGSTNVVLFSDRCQDKISLVRADKLRSIEETVRRAATHYRFNVNVAFDPETD